MDWDSDDDLDLDRDQPRTIAGSIRLQDPGQSYPNGQDPRKRRNSQSVGDFRLSIVSDHIREIFPVVHVPTLRARIGKMLTGGYPESSIVEILSDEIGECGGDFPQADRISDPNPVAPAKFFLQSNTSQLDVANVSANTNANTNAAAIVSESSASTAHSTGARQSTSSTATTSGSASISAARTASCSATTSDASVPKISKASTAVDNSMFRGLQSPNRTSVDDPIVIPDNSPRGDGPIVISDDDGAAANNTNNNAAEPNNTNNNAVAPNNTNNNAAAPNNTNKNAAAPKNNIENALAAVNNSNIDDDIRPSLDLKLNENMGKGKGVGKGQSNRSEPKQTYNSVIAERMKQFFPLIRPYYTVTFDSSYPDAIKILQHIFIGYRKNNVETIYRRYSANLTKTVAKIVEATLKSREPELIPLMLSRNPTEELWAQRNSYHASRALYLDFDVGGLYKMMVLCSWRKSIKAANNVSNGPLSIRHAQEEAADLDQWLDAVFGDQNDISFPFSPLPSDPSKEGGESSSSLLTSPLPSPSVPSPSIPSPSAPSPSPLSPSVLSPTPEQPGIECQCCFSDCRFDDLVQCMEGHLFCRDCIKMYAQSAISGEGKSTLTCIAGECKERFPRGQLEACLEPQTMKLLEEREQEESVRLACAEEEGAEKLAQCPHCPYKVYLPEGNKVIECMNPECMKATCIQCNQDWEAHCGIPCKEFENKDEESLRLKAEEKMTAALLRVCHKCKTPLIKEEGCNKLTCRCGAKMCYVCRASIKNYDHFCNHPRDPGQGCTKCKRCSLWTNPKEDDERAMEEIRLAAEKEKEEKGFVNERKIGVAHGSNQAAPNQPAQAPPPGGVPPPPGGARPALGGAPPVPGGAPPVPGGAPPVPGGAPPLPGGAPPVPGHPPAVPRPRHVHPPHAPRR